MFMEGPVAAAMVRARHDRRVRIPSLRVRIGFEQLLKSSKAEKKEIVVSVDPTQRHVCIQRATPRSTQCLPQPFRGLLLESSVQMSAEEASLCTFHARRVCAYSVLHAWRYAVEMYGESRFACFQAGR